jgi:CheY-like chemotaxis protein
MSTTASGKEILIVDDDGPTRDALAMTLEAAGYTVRQAADGREAFRLLRVPPPPSAILLDIVMPGMSGWEVLRERDANHSELADTPVIVFSAACEVAPRMPLPRGVARLLPKPVDGEEVLAVLGEILETLEQQLGAAGGHGTDLAAPVPSTRVDGLLIRVGSPGSPAVPRPAVHDGPGRPRGTCIAITNLRGGGVRVVIIEDNRAAADSMRFLLDLYGYEVRVAYTGPDGVQVAEDWPPDFVLCDIGLPGLDGYGVAEALRHHPATTRAHLIAITAYGSEEARRRSREVGFERHLTKPVDPDTVLDLLAAGR